MAIFPLRTFGDPVLRTVTTPVSEIDAGVEKLVADLIETMYDAPGVGLAANQIGVPKRVIVIDLSGPLLVHRQARIRSSDVAEPRR